MPIYQPACRASVIARCAKFQRGRGFTLLRRDAVALAGATAGLGARGGNGLSCGGEQALFEGSGSERGGSRSSRESASSVQVRDGAQTSPSSRKRGKYCAAS